MPVSATVAGTLTVAETLATNVVDATSPVITHNGFNFSATLNASSTPPISKMASFQKALSTGAATIDCTSLIGTNGASVDFTGLKVQGYIFQNPATNANAITVTVGASNGLLLHGASWKVILQPGEQLMFLGLNVSQTVGSGNKTIDLAGTGSQALNCILVAG